jgi:hypothetical protein
MDSNPLSVPRGESAAIDESYTVQRQARSGMPTVYGHAKPLDVTPRPSRMLRHPVMHVIGRKPVHFLDVNFDVLDRPVADVFKLERIAWGVLEQAVSVDVGVPLSSWPVLNATSPLLERHLATVI